MIVCTLNSFHTLYKNHSPGFQALINPSHISTTSTLLPTQSLICKNLKELQRLEGFIPPPKRLSLVRNPAANFARERFARSSAWRVDPLRQSRSHYVPNDRIQRSSRFPFLHGCGRRRDFRHLITLLHRLSRNVGNSRWNMDGIKTIHLPVK